MRRGRFQAYIIVALIFQSLIPINSIGLVSATATPSTEVTVDGNYLYSSDNSTITTKSSLTFTFNVTVPSGNFTSGTYSYSGVSQGSGSFNESGTSIEIASNFSGHVYLSFFANSTEGSEGANLLEIVFDHTPPTSSVQPLSNSTFSSTTSTNIITASPTGVILLDCSDTFSTVEFLKLIRNGDQTELLNISNSSSVVVLVSDIITSDANLSLSCTDYFENEGRMQFLIEIDDFPPVLTVFLSGPIDGVSCLPPSWSLSLTAEDSSPPVQLEFSLDNQSTWGPLSNPFTPPLNFSGELYLSATDAVGNRNIESVIIPGFDQENPEIAISTIGRNHTITFSDDCDSDLTVLYRWESVNGTHSSWSVITENNTTLEVPESYHITGYRLLAKATDDSSRTTITSTGFSSGYGSPLTIVFSSANHQGYSLPEGNLTIANPSNLNYYLLVTEDGSQLENLYANNSTYSRDFSFSEASSVVIKVNYTHLDGSNQSQSFSYVIDGTVGTLPGLALTGTTVEVGGTTVASPTTVVTLSNLTDDPSGVGYSGVECRNGSSAWTTVTGSSFAIPSLPDAETAFSIECRISDLLGNLGASSWTNGTVDALAPTVSSNIISGQVLTNLITISVDCNDSSIALPDFLEVTPTIAGFGQSQVHWLSSGFISVANLNLSDGPYSMDLFCIDSLGNYGNLSIENLNFLSESPGIFIGFSEGNNTAVVDGAIYASQGAEATIELTTNGHSEVSISYTMESNDGYLAQYQSENSTTLSFSNLSDGVYYINASVCGSGLCFSADSSVTIDTQAPPVAQYWISSEGVTFSTDVTILVGRELAVRPWGIVDSGSPLDEIYCQIDNGSAGSFSMPISSSTWWSPWIWDEGLDGHNGSLGCQVKDVVNNTSPLFSTDLSFEFSLPEIYSELATNYLVADATTNVGCSDDSEIENQLIVWAENQSSAFLLNDQFSGQYSQLLLFVNVSNGDSIGLQIRCTDVYGNTNQTDINWGVYISSVGLTGIEFSSIHESSSSKYFGNASLVQVSPEFPLGIVSILAISTNYETWSAQFSATEGSFAIANDTFESMYSTFSTSIAYLQILHEIPNSSISATIEVGIVEWVNSSPSVVSIEQSFLANGSTTRVTLTDSVCGSFQLSYTLQSIEVSLTVDSAEINVTMPHGESGNETLSLGTEDCLGNTKQETWVLTRDMVMPTFEVTGHLAFRISNTTEITVSTEDDSGILTRAVSLTYGNSTIQVCEDSTSVCQIGIGGLFTLADNTTAYLDVSLSTFSGQELSASSTFLVDIVVEGWSIDYSESTFVDGIHISNHSTIKFEFEEHLSSFCINHSISTIGQGCWDDVFQVDWTPLGEASATILVIHIGLLDDVGNYHDEFLSFNYSNEAPSLSSSAYVLPQPGWVDFEIVHGLPVMLEISGGNNSQYSQNSSAYFLYEGVFSENITFTDSTGNSLTVQNVSVIIDSTAPEMNVSLSDAAFVGHRTWLNATSTDWESMITELTVYMYGQAGGCGAEFEIPQSSVTSRAIQLSEIIAQPDCNLSMDANYSLTILVNSSNGAGIGVYYSESLQFIGEVAQSAIGLDGTHYIPTSPDDAIVSNHSKLWCEASHPVPVEVSISVVIGNYTGIGTNLVEWGSGNGLVRCDVTDSLGNSAHRWFNLTYSENDVEISSSVLNGNDNFSRLGETNFAVNVTSGFPIVGIEVFEQSTSLMETSNGSFEVNMASLGYTSGGSYDIRIMAHNVLGYHTNHSLTVVLDNSVPSFEILEGDSYVLDQNQSMLLSAHGSITIGVGSDDAQCEVPPVVTSQNATQITQNGWHFFLTVPHNATGLEILVTDCVGWQESGSFQIERYSIPAPQIHIDGGFFVNGSHAIVPGSSVFSTSQLYPVILELELECQVDWVSVDCSGNSPNSWSGGFDINSHTALLTLSFSDQIGNSMVEWMTLEVDSMAPECILPTAVEVGGISFLHETTNSEVSCSDSQTAPNSVWVNSTSHSHWFEESESQYIDLSTGGNWTITSRDHAGNENIQAFTVVEDQEPPMAFCRPSRLAYYPVVIHSPGNESMLCSVIDAIPSSYNFTFLRGGIELSSGWGNTPTFLAPLPEVGNGDNLLLKVMTADLLGNQNASTFSIIIDDELPEIRISPMSASSNEMPQNVADLYGSIVIEVLDDNLVSFDVMMSCNDETVTLSQNQSTAHIEVSDYIGPECEVLGLTVETYDRAGNFREAGQIFVIDKAAPAASLGSSCYFDSMADFHVIVEGCILMVGTSDDSGYNSSSLVRIGTDWYEFGSQFFEIALSDYMDSHANTSLLLVVQDQSGKSSTIEKVFRISDDASLVVDSTNCELADLDCSQNSVTIRSGYHEISTVNPQPYNSVPIIHSSGICRAPGTCDFSTTGAHLSFNSSQLQEGWHTIDVEELDALGRTASISLEVWIDLSGPQMVSLDSIPLSSDQQPQSGGTHPMHPICGNPETCKFELTFIEDSDFVVSGNFDNEPVRTSLGGGEWKVTIPLTPDNIKSNSGDSLNITIRSQSGHEFSYGVPIQWVDPGAIVIETSISKCLNARNFVGNWGAEDVVCLYDHDEIYAGHLAVNFSFPDSNFPVGYSLGYYQNFSNLIPRWGMSGQLLIGQTSTWYLPMLEEQPPDAWMNYSISYELASNVSAQEITIHFIRTDAARPTFSIVVDRNQHNVVSESGLTEVVFMVEVDGNLPEIAGLSFRAMPLLESLRADLMGAKCSWELELVSLETLGRVVPDRPPEPAPCAAAVTIWEESLRVALPPNSLVSPYGGGSGHASLPLFMVERADLQITFTHSKTEQVYSLGPIRPSLEKTPDSPLFFPEGFDCQDAVKKGQKWFESAVNWARLKYCLAGATAADEVTHAGIRLTWFEPLSPDQQRVVTIICPVDQVPTTFEGWWGINRSPRCEVIGEVPNENGEFSSVHMEAVGCTLRCSLDGFSEEGLLTFQTNEISVQLDNGRFADPDLDDTGYRFAGLIIVVMVLFMLLNSANISRSPPIVTPPPKGQGPNPDTLVESAETLEWPPPPPS